MCLSSTAEKHWAKPQEAGLKLLRLVLVQRGAELPVDMARHVKRICAAPPARALGEARTQA